ncbi:hypothetical protein PAPYR_13315 [Paratrimastix pyriformis]|uniref:Tyrosine-protein kinase ephrin type A/B receptor-like domain-containing protein n=1 Tax=Paratrimastix pyriformis TaxID=342808 RepID=A0ABQ8U404_9EUKA|nr:hypothetical protein PAPYR_13315 [Paratrimastix pyriformis]
MVIEQSTRSIYSFSYRWRKNHDSDLHHLVASLPAGGVPFVDGCLFYGGPMGFDSAKFTITQQSGAWNEIPGKTFGGDLDLEWNFRTRNKDPTIVRVPPYVFILAANPHMNSEGSVFHVQTTSTSFETRVDPQTSSPTVALNWTGIYHDWDRRVSAMWSVGQRLFLISTSKSSGEARFDVVCQRSTMVLSTLGDATAPTPPSTTTPVPENKTESWSWVPDTTYRELHTLCRTCHACQVVVSEAGLDQHLGIGQPPQDLVDTLAQNLIGSVKVATLNEIAYFYLPPRDSADPASHWDWRYNATANTWVTQEVDVTAFAPSQCNDRDHTIFFGCFDVKSLLYGYVPALICGSRRNASHPAMMFFLVNGTFLPDTVSTLTFIENMLIYAGGTAHGTVFDDLWYQVVDTGLWLNSPSIHLPEPRAFAQAIVWQGKIYIIGGEVWITGGSYTTNTWIYRLSLSEMAWLEPHRPEGMGTQSLRFHTMLWLGSFVLVHGGASDLPTPYYLLIETRWQPWIPSSISDIPAHRYGAVMFFFGDSVAVFGGQTDNGTTNSLVVLGGPQSRSYGGDPGTRISPTPRRLSSIVCLAAPLEEERVFIVGGCSLPIGEDDLDKAECPNSTLYVLSACPAGTRFTNKRCEPCPAGSYSNYGATKCLPCPQGSFNPFQGQSECAGKCDLGWYSEKPGAVNELSCRPCQAGTYSPVHGSNPTQCLPCPAGTYSSQNGAPSRDACLSCDGALCRPGATTPLEMNLTVSAAKLPPFPPLDDVTGGRIKNFIYYAMGGLVGLVALISLILVLCCSGIHKSRVARGLHRIDLWPAFVGRVEQFGLPIRNSSALGGIVTLCFFVVVIGFLARNILDVIPQFNTKREWSLVEGLPAAAQGLAASVSIVSLAHHGPCDIEPTLSTGSFNQVTFTQLPDGSCQMNMSLGVQLLADATITVNVSSATEQVYNGGWWWEIHVDGIDNIHNVTFQNRTLPPSDDTVFRGSTSTALKLAMTFTNYTLSYDQWHQRNFQYWNFVQEKPEVSYPEPTKFGTPPIFRAIFQIEYPGTKFRDLREDVALLCLVFGHRYFELAACVLVNVSLLSSPLHVSPLANPLPACFSSQIHCLHVVPTRKSTACMFLSSQIPCLHVSPTRARTLDSKKKELFDVLQAFIGVFSDEMWRIAIESLSSEPAHFALSSEGLPPAGRASADRSAHYLTLSGRHCAGTLTGLGILKGVLSKGLGLFGKAVARCCQRRVKSPPEGPSAPCNMCASPYLLPPAPRKDDSLFVYPFRSLGSC